MKTVKTLEALATTTFESRRTREELTRLTGLSDRAVRTRISELRHKGFWIISDTDRPGYYIGTQDQWNMFCRKMMYRAQHTFYARSFANERQVTVC